MKRKHGILFLAAVILILGISQVPNLTDHVSLEFEAKDSMVTQRELRRSFFEKREVLVIYGAPNDQMATEYNTLLQEFSNRPDENSRRNISISFKAASEVTTEELKENILYLVGTPSDNPLLKTFSQNMPIQLTEKEIALNNQSYSNKEALISIGFYPNFQNDTLPISILSGNDGEIVLDFFRKKIELGGRFFFRQNMDYEVYENGKRVVMGDFDEHWQLDKATYFDFSTKNFLVHSSNHYDFIAHGQNLSPSMVKSLAPEIEETTLKILDFIGTTAKIPRMSYHIYESVEDKGLMLGNTDQAHFNLEDLSVHSIINEKYRNNFIEKENGLLVEHLLGEAKTKALQHGLPVYFTDQWQREGYRYWTARLFESGNIPSLNELLNNETLELESPLIVDCVSASLVGFLVNRWGKNDFLHRYKEWMPTAKEIKELEAGWSNHLIQNARTFPKKTRIISELPYLKGFNFAHEGYGIHNGYTGSKAVLALKKMNDLGSNAMALVPYSFISDKNTPAPFWFNNGAGSENDQGVIHSAYEAKKMGMTTILKPQVWGGGTWPGEIEMPTEEDWKAFFDYYYKWIRHYAFLAEIHGIDVLCVGVEFAKATLTHENEWRRIFRKLGELYGGKLTYAANWGAEFEQVGFWDELDFIGLNCYYPLSKNDSVTKDELKANFDAVKSKIEKVSQKFKKQVVFIEIGFRSIDAPWKSPHAEGDDSFNEEHQRLCYEVVFEGIADEEWCQGILWWKFPSFLEYRGRENSAFTPNNKKAEQTVKAWFSR